MKKEILEKLADMVAAIGPIEGGGELVGTTQVVISKETMTKALDDVLRKLPKGWVIGGRRYTADEALELLLQNGLITMMDFANYYGRCRYSDTMHIVNEEGVPIPIINHKP